MQTVPLVAGAVDIIPVTCRDDACVAGITLAQVTFSGESTPVQITLTKSGDKIYEALLPRSTLTTLHVPIESTKLDDQILSVREKVDWASVPGVVHGEEADAGSRLLAVQWYLEK